MNDDKAGLAVLLTTILVTFVAFSAILKMIDQEVTTYNSTLDEMLLRELQTIDTKGINKDYIYTVGVEESGHGKSQAYKLAKNIFNITDDESGIKIGKRKYKIYAKAKDSINDYVRLISTRRRYHHAYRAGVYDNRLEFFSALQKAKYAEDPQYAMKLERVFNEIKDKEYKNLKGD